MRPSFLSLALLLAFNVSGLSSSLAMGQSAGAPAASSPAAAAPSTDVPPTIQTPVKDQQNPITGTATPSTAQKPVKVKLFVKTTPGATAVAHGSEALVDTDGSYELHVTVNAGEILEVRETGTSLTGASAQSEDVTVIAADNEREHIDFFAGTVLSQNESSFSQADTFLALNVDRALYRPGFYRDNDTTCGADGHSSCRKKCGKDNEKDKDKDAHPCTSHRPGVNTFFQARLTTIPVNASTATQTATTTTTSTSSTASTTPATVSLSSVLTSQKTGHFEGGIYFPFAFARVPLKGPHTQAFYVAPIYRFGFNTLADSAQTTNTTATTATGNSTATMTTSSTPTALGTTSPLPNSYNFFTMGTRIGTATIEPGSLHNIHYLDITIGKFSNLDNLYCPKGTSYTACAAVPATSNTAAILATPENRYRPFRLSFEGYYQVPVTGFILGMSANVGTGFLDSHANTDINQRAPTDLRFLFGYKFDVNKLFKALPSITQ